MSALATSLVWAADVPRPWKLILLAYADHASDDGSNIFPDQDRVALKTGYSRREVNTITGELVDAGILTKEALRGHGVIVYRMNYSGLAHRHEVGGREQ